MNQEAALNFGAQRNCDSSLQVFVVFRGVLDQDNGAVEISLHPRSHDYEVPPQVSHPEKLGLEGESRAGLVFSKLTLSFII